MNIYDVAIIGGGVSGLSCAAIIGSAIKNEQFARAKKVIIFDSDKSDVKKAVFNNAIGVPFGEDGRETIARMNKQIEQFPNIERKLTTINKIEELNGKFKVSCFEGIYWTEKVVIASGFKYFFFESLGIAEKQHLRTDKPSRYVIENQDYKVRKNLYVCGVISGHSNQFAIAAGSGAQVGVHIISDWAGEWKIIHDKLGK